MTRERAIAWAPVPEIVSPCADISYAYQGSGDLRVVMRFSRVVGQPKRDLELRFRDASALRWEAETFGLVPLPKPPRLQADRWRQWSFPLLRVEGSAWAALYRDRDASADGDVHFALVSMNDVLHVLAPPEVAAQWIPAEPNG